MSVQALTARQKILDRAAKKLEALLKASPDPKSDMKQAESLFMEAGLLTAPLTERRPFPFAENLIADNPQAFEQSAPLMLANNTRPESAESVTELVEMLLPKEMDN